MTERRPPPSADVPVRFEQRMVMLATSGLLLFWVADLFSAPRTPWDTLALRAAWVACFWALAWALTRVRVEHRWGVRLLMAGPVFHGFYAVLVQRMGGTDGLLFAWFAGVPMVFAPLARGDRRVAVPTGLFSIGTVVALLVHEGRGASMVAAWAVAMATSAAMLVVSSHVMGERERALAREARALAREAAAQAREAQARQALAAGQTLAAEGERLAQLGRLAAGVAHEVNNPLAYVRSNIGFVRDELRAPTPGIAPDELDAAFDEALAGLDRIASIVADLRVLGRTPPPVQPLEDHEEGTCALAPLVDEALRVARLRLRAPVVVERHVPEDLPEVACEPRRLSQVLLNLLLNAADALDERQPEAPRVVVRAGARDGRVWLSVEDNGPGVPPEVLPQLFTPFFTTKPAGQGTGLGLAVSRQYVEAFGGRLTADAAPLGGARFTVELGAVGSAPRG